MKRTALIAFSDIHSGHRLGLMHPDVDLLDEDEFGNPVAYHPQLTATQAYLWKCYCDDLAGALERIGADEAVAIYLGDPIQGKAFNRELVTCKMADQIMIAIANIGFCLEQLPIKAMYFATGTEVHELNEGSASTLIVDNLKKTFPDRTLQLCNQGLIDVGGAEIDFAHHGPNPGTKMWNRGNAARSYLLDIMHKDIEDRGKVPDLVLRAHYHEFIWERVTVNTVRKDYESAIAILPSYCFVDFYIRKATRSLAQHDVGLGVFDIVDGKILGLNKQARRVDIRTRIATA